MITFMTAYKRIVKSTATKNLLLFKSILLTCIVFSFHSSLFARKNIPADSGYFSSFDGTKIYYETNGAGYPVLLVHGFIVNGNSWKNTAIYDSLLAAGYKVITPDLRGNGKSDKPHTNTGYNNDAEAKDLMLLMHYLHINHYDVIGYSRGSIITARLLVLDKKSVNNAVMGGMGTDFTNPDWPRRIMFYEALTYDTVASLHNMVQYVQKTGLDQQALALLQKFQPSTPITVLKKLKNHILVIRGNDDDNNLNAVDLAKVFPKGEFAITPGDHNHASSTPEFAKTVMAFIRKY